LLGDRKSPKRCGDFAHAVAPQKSDRVGNAP